MSQAQHRNLLPQLDGSLFLTDGGIETTLIFQEGLELPDFAAFVLLRDERGTAALRRYFRSYAGLAEHFGTGLILESPTWRANPDWSDKLGYSRSALQEANHAAIRLMDDIRSEMTAGNDVVISGCIGPRGDGYVPSRAMTSEEAADYHGTQAGIFSGTAADMLCAITMNYSQEAIGVSLAAQRAGLPAAISFTVETDGRLPTGQSLKDAIQEVDAATGAYPAYYMLNCAHPSHFESQLNGEAWTRRIRGLRANASRQSHAELNESPSLDIGDPRQLGVEYALLRQSRLPNLNVMGGCCGTDHRHVKSMAEACSA